MSDKPAKAMGGGCLGGLTGAVLGILIGGFVGPMLATAKGSHDPYGLFDACAGFFGLLLGVGIGGIVGGIGGSVLGAGLAVSGSSAPTQELPSVIDASSTELPEPPTGSADAEWAQLEEQIRFLPSDAQPPAESPEAELARLKEQIAEAELARLRARIAELEGKEPEDDRSQG
jgi:hypothetical protein